MKKLVSITVLCIIAMASYAQSNSVTGTWKSAKENTLIKIAKEADEYSGIIVSSDDNEVKPGTKIIKDIRYKKDKWEGKIYAPKRNEWYNIELNPIDNKLVITVYVGFISKKIEWEKV